MSSSRAKLAIYLTVGILVAGALFHGVGVALLTENSNNAHNIYNGEVVAYKQVNWKSRLPWEQLPPSKSLVWHECFPERQCARLIVPLNHSDPEGDKAIIALVRKQSSIPPSSKFYRGPILFNPGGPGGSGVDLIMGPRGDLLSTIVGPEFDVVGFDPRGISRSTPRASFFKTDVERSLWDKSGSSLVNNSNEGVSRTLARAKIVGALAVETDNGYLKHINTDQTARDMLHIVQAHGKSKLQYWGFSYGSILGATFASIFPDKIERMIIDGVVDAEDYYSVDKWMTSLFDTDKVLDGFFSGCAHAGPEICEFWAPTAEHIRRNLTTLLENIRLRPLPIKSGLTYGILDYEKLKGSIFTSLYTPYASFPKLAKALAELANGDGVALYNLIPESQVECSCNPSEHMFDRLTDATTAVICNDGERVPDDIKEAEEHFEMAMKMSQWNDLWTRIRFGCVGWPEFPKTQFRGPFEAKTSHPILLIGNTADPVTPIWAARNMSRGFEGSVVLQQNSLGHGSISGPSLCTQQYVRKYFQDGSLPPAGTICEVDAQPFPDPVLVSEGAQAALETHMTFEEHEILAAVHDLSKMSVVTPFFKL